MADESEETPRKKAPARKRTASSGTAKKRSDGSGTQSTRTTKQRSRPTAVKIARSAREQLTDLLDRDSESVVGVQRTDDGWEVDVEVVETRRIPDTTDVLAIYRVQLDGSGDIEGYERLERYIRGQAEGGGARG